MHTRIGEIAPTQASSKKGGPCVSCGENPANARVGGCRVCPFARHRTAVAPLAAAVLSALVVGACGGAAISDPTRHVPTSRAEALTHVSSGLVVFGPGRPTPAWRTTATIGARPAVWIARRSGVTFIRLDQRLVHLALHVGSGEPGGRGWSHGDRIGPSEIHRVVFGFNGGFKLTYGSVGFMADGRVAVGLKAGFGSIVTYQDGSTQIGAWRAGVPAHGRTVSSVLENLRLLVDRGAPASTVGRCVLLCWGGTVGDVTFVPRSALGITADGQLIWAAGRSLSPRGIAEALIGVGVRRAVQLDINPVWVAGYLYVHHPRGPIAVPVMPGQHGIPGRLLRPDTRDFFTVLAN